MRHKHHNVRHERRGWLALRVLGGVCECDERLKRMRSDSSTDGRADDNAFSDADNAQRFASRVEEAGQVWIEPGQAAGNTVYRVYFGRWPDEGGAHAARASLADWGVYDARVIDLH